MGFFFSLFFLGWFSSTVSTSPSLFLSLQNFCIMLLGCKAMCLEISKSATESIYHNYMHLYIKHLSVFAPVSRNDLNYASCEVAKSTIVHLLTSASSTPNSKADRIDHHEHSIFYRWYFHHHVILMFYHNEINCLKTIHICKSFTCPFIQKINKQTFLLNIESKFPWDVSLEYK